MKAREDSACGSWRCQRRRRCVRDCHLRHLRHQQQRLPSAPLQALCCGSDAACAASTKIESERLTFDRMLDANEREQRFPPRPFLNRALSRGRSLRARQPRRARASRPPWPPTPRPCDAKAIACAAAPYPRCARYHCCSALTAVMAPEARAASVTLIATRETPTMTSTGRLPPLHDRQHLHRWSLWSRLRLHLVPAAAFHRFCCKCCLKAVLAPSRNPSKSRN